MYEIPRNVIPTVDAQINVIDSGEINMDESGLTSSQYARIARVHRNALKADSQSGSTAQRAN